MAKNALTDYSTTAALNTDIGGISTEGTQTVNNWDNIVREQMKQLADHVAAPTFLGASMTFTSTDAGAASAPVINLYRDSATPAANDFIGNISYQGEDSAGNTQIYAEISGQIIDPTSTSEDGRIQVFTTIAGSPAARVSIGNGLYMASTAGDPGAGSIAAANLLLNSTGTLNFGAGDVVLTHATNTLAFTGASSGYTYDAVNTVARTSDGQGFTVSRSAGATGSMYVDTAAAWFGSLTNHPVYFYVNNGGVTAAVTSTILGVGCITAFALTSGTADGAYVEAAGAFVASVSADSSLRLRRRTSDGTIATFHRDTTNVGTISVTTTATAYNTSSDERLKKNFHDFDAGAIIDAITMYGFDFKAGGQGYGVKAQDAANSLVPNFISPGNDKKPEEEGFEGWSADYSKLVPILLREVQSLRKRIAVLDEAKP